MVPIHVPNNQDKNPPVQVDPCHDLHLIFAEPGELLWEGPRWEFNPHLPEGHVGKGKTEPIVAPNHDITVTWTFIADHSKAKSSGKIEVFHKETLRDGGAALSSRGQER